MRGVSVITACRRIMHYAIVRLKSVSVTGDTTVIEKGFNQTGRGPASPLLRRALCAWRHLIQSIQSIVDMHGKQELFSSGSANTVLQQCVHISKMMPQKTHSLPQGPSHLATPFIGAHRASGFLTPWPTIPSLSIVLPLRREAFSLLPVPPFVARLGLFLRLLLRASLGDAAWHRVASVQPASRQTTCSRLGNKSFGCCVYC